MSFKKVSFKKNHRARAVLSFLGTVSSLALMCSTPALSQPIEEVVVTGTHIRGVAPVGSTLTSVGQDDLKKTGETSVVDLLQKLPEILSTGYNPGTLSGRNIQSSAGTGASLTPSICAVSGQRPRLAS